MARPITTVAGTGQAGARGDGGLAFHTEFDEPRTASGTRSTPPSYVTPRMTNVVVTDDLGDIAGLVDASGRHIDVVKA